MPIDLAHVEIHILGVADAAMEEAQVAAAFEDKERLVEPATELDQKQQVKLLDEWMKHQSAHRGSRAFTNTNNQH